MRTRLGILLIGSALVIGALGAGAWWFGSTRQEVLTDDGAIEHPAGLVTPRDILWRPPEVVDPGVVPPSGAGGAYSPTGGRFAFAAPGPGGDLDLFEAVESAEGWTARRLALTSSADQETTPTYSPDGRWLWFASDRPGGEGGFDLWRAPASGEGWGVAEHVAMGGLVQTTADEMSPALSPDGTLLAFARRADASNPSDLVILDLEGRPTPTRVAHGLNTEGEERAPAFSPAGDFLYFSSDREGGAGGLDLFRTRMSQRRPTEAVWLGEEVNSAGDETDPTLAMAGFRMRFRASGGEEAGYRETTAREVYRTVRSRWPSLGIGQDLLKLLPWLLLALALALLFAGLRRTASHELWQRRWGTLGLMARCVLASIFLHALLALLLSLWRVETTLPGLDEGSETRVRLTSHADVTSAAAQVRAAAVGAHEAPREPSERVTPVTSDAPSERTLESESAASGPTVQRPTDSAAAAPTAAPVDPSTQAPSVETPALPSATQARSAESGSREAEVRAARSEPAAQAAEAAETRLDPSERALDRPTARRLADAPGGGDASADAAPSGAELPLESALPDLPTTQRVASSESDSRESGGAPSSPSFTPLPAGQAGGAFAVETSDAESGPTPAGALTDAAAEPPTESTSEVAIALDAGGAAAPELPTGTPSETRAEPESRVAAGSPSVSPVASSPVDVTTFDSSPGMTALAPASIPLAAVTDAVTVSLPETALPAFETGGAALPVPDAVRAEAREEASASPAVAATPEHRAGEARPTDPVELSAEASQSGAVSGRLREARESPTVEIAEAPLSQPRRMTPMLPIARVIAGIVVNDLTGEPIPEASVRLDGEGDLIRRAVAGEDGRFTLTPAQLPEFAALTASAEGFITAAVNVAEEDVGEGTWVELRLQPESRFDIALDPEPRVHHLGNDEFSGQINSQFQMASEGTRYRAVIVLDAEQLAPPIAVAELHIFVRGAQNANPIAVNGQMLETTLSDSPNDGSFGEFVARVPMNLLRVGENIIQIRATSRQGTDIDDFEFVNPRLVLKQRVRRGNRI